MASPSEPTTAGFRPKAIHQLSVSTAYGDAIGNEVMAIRSALHTAGFESEIFVELIDPRMAGEVRPYAQYREISDPDNVVLLHYSLGSKVADLAHEIRDRLVLIYHNITPAHWFVPYDLGLARNCERGRLDLEGLAPRTSLGLGDSEFNRMELEELGFDPTGVLPLVLDFSRLDGTPDPIVMQRFGDGRTNILFVGRVVPNKRFEDLLRAFAYYRRYVDHSARLLVVGEYRTFAPYYDGLQRLVARLGIDEVHFTGHVTQAELSAFYRVADCFLCLSEHEGFCVPLFEAMHCDVPVVAFSAAAIPYSTGGGILLIEDKDPALVAETVTRVVEDAPLREAVVSRQRIALEDIEPNRLMAGLLEQLALLPA